MLANVIQDRHREIGTDGVILNIKYCALQYVRVTPNGCTQQTNILIYQRIYDYSICYIKWDSKIVEDEQNSRATKFVTNILDGLFFTI
jgi:hypothetical protein